MRTKRFYAVVIAALVIISALIWLSGCTTQASEGTAAEKDYTGVFVGELSKDEQIKIARSPQLSAQVNWGEGGPLYSREVAEAFLLDYPFPGYLEEKHGKYEPSSPWEKERNAIAFLSQSPINDASVPGSYLREIWLYTGSGAYQVFLYVDADGTILESSTSFLVN